MCHERSGHQHHVFVTVLAVKCFGCGLFFFTLYLARAACNWQSLQAVGLGLTIGHHVEEMTPTWIALPDLIGAGEMVQMIPLLG